MVSSEQTEHNKKKILEALEKSFGIVTTACKVVGVGRTQFYQWLKDDAEFKEQVDDLQNVTLDMAESQLHKQILDGNTTATIFYLKTKGKKRGFIERQEITGIEGTKLFDIKVVKRKDDDTDGDTN